MNRAELFKSIIDIAERDTGENYQSITANTSLRNEMGMDSVDVVSVVATLERKFRVRFAQAELENIFTAGDVLDLLEQKIVEKGQK